MRYENIAEFDTKLTADVVEWRPKSNMLACATYYLDKEKTIRQGGIHLIQVDEDNRKLKLLQTFNYDTSGILDLKWLDENNLITIDSNNTLSLLRYNSSNLKLVESNDLSPKEVNVGLTLDYARDASLSTTYKVISSDSTGNIYVTSIDQNNVSLVDERRCHDLEIWSVMIDKSEPNLIYSGADDCTLKIWDMRQKDLAASVCQIFEGLQKQNFFFNFN